MKTNTLNIPALFLCFLLTSCSSVKPAAVAPLPLHENYGTHSFKITTGVPEAQSTFDRGLTLAYAFSHAAAEKEFRRAAELDPRSPMPWWGVALVNGPHINFPLVPEANAKIAWDALMRAKELSGNAASPLEKRLIGALEARYAARQPKDRSKLDEGYAAEMKKVWGEYSGEADVAMLYAESMMDLHPWNLFDAKGQARPWTPEILAVLERGIKINPKHPGLLHLYIHAIEASNTPERGVTAADTLGPLVPAAGHLVHMPAHIYIRVGRWEDAAKANEAAIRADAEYSRKNPNPGFYGVYMTHNRHFLSFVHMMQGRKAPSVEAARAMIAAVPPQFVKDFGPVADGFFAFPYEVLMRFGDWEGVLNEPDPPAGMPLAAALRRFARTTAYTALDRKEEALKERGEFLKAVKRVPRDSTFGNNKSHTLLKIARLVLDGEMAAREEKYGKAVTLLTEAVKIEDTLTYDEPPDWVLPVRHTLGVALLKAGKYGEAERVYAEDLTKFPKNVWSLQGMSRALALQGRDQEAQAIRVAFESAASGADIKIESSCLCQKGV